jgi:hypothetical protein
MATKRRTKAKTKISSQAVMDELKTLAMLTGGVVIGSVGGKMIDKVLAPGSNTDSYKCGYIRIFVFLESNIFSYICV